ncbi:LysR family transcriptional regulator [Paraglaciecola aquimarina]|uniref:LysR family transcriptional regulator n=1 Tax=Paraglaciecola algarum TaxID=3050085 RepID=A0ABS9D7T9_9ALTE|nr:LysR family transcriptional regulator [Paraglaciecola sp. G1-23]MCF2949018.1 LysR family transcriptional regulator [Paraglaciecola sp. G1-23]
MLKVEQLKIFIALTELNTMTAVANNLQVSVMAISKSIALLEKEVGQPLFSRTRRSFTLTQFGHDFKSHAQQVVAQLDTLESWVEEKNGSISGTVKVLCQAPEMIHETIIPWLDKFLALYPNIKVELDVKESIIDLNTDDYDVFWGVSDYLGDTFSGLKRRTLWTCDYGLYASPSYLARHTEIKTLDDLNSHTVIGYLHNQPADIIIFQSETGEPTHKVIHNRVKSVTGLVEMACNGLGIINAGNDDVKILPALAANKLQPILPDHWYKNVSTYVYFHQVKGEQAKVRSFIDYFIAQKKFWGLG